MFIAFIGQCQLLCFSSVLFADHGKVTGGEMVPLGAISWQWRPDIAYTIGTYLSRPCSGLLAVKQSDKYGTGSAYTLHVCTHQYFENILKKLCIGKA